MQLLLLLLLHQNLSFYRCVQQNSSYNKNHVVTTDLRNMECCRIVFAYIKCSRRQAGWGFLNNFPYITNDELTKKKEEQIIDQINEREKERNI